MTGFVYLASPYTPHADESIKARVDAACAKAAAMMVEGEAVFSPIAHSHYVAQFLPEGVALDHAFWMHQDLAILRHAKKLVVMMLPGWDKSKGIEREVEAAYAADIPVEFVEP